YVHHASTTPDSYTPSLHDALPIYDIPKQSTIVVYCAVGNRAERIGEKLLKAGYKHVYNLYGGIFEWMNQGNPVYTSGQVQTSERSEEHTSELQSRENLVCRLLLEK